MTLTIRVIQMAVFVLLGTSQIHADEVSGSLFDFSSFQSTGTQQLVGLGYQPTAPGGLWLQTDGGEYGPVPVGTFTIRREDQNVNYRNEVFRFVIAFQPTLGSQAGPTEWSGVLSGLIHKSGAPQEDVLMVAFGTPTQLMSFNDGIHQAAFLFSVSDPVRIVLDKASSVGTGTVYGRISQAGSTTVPTVPEASSILMFGTGLMLVGGVMKVCRSRLVPAQACIKHVEHRSDRT